MNESKTMSMLGRIRRGVRWRWDHLVRAYLGWLAGFGPKAFVAIRWPWPLSRPWQRRKLRICTVGGGVGDEIMAEQVIRQIKERNPECVVTFVSRYADLFAASECIDHIEPFDIDASFSGVTIGYEHAVPSDRSLTALMAECVGILDRGVPMRDYRPKNVSQAVRDRLAALKRPYIAVQPRAGRWTPNKQWPAEYWIDLAKDLVQTHDVVEVGETTMFESCDLGDGFQSFAGETNLGEFAETVKGACMFVGPPSAGMHMANGFGVPAVIVFGGYESPIGYDHPRMRGVYNPVDCAPCWLTTPCPHDRKCLREISPKQALETVRGFLIEQEQDGSDAALECGDDSRRGQPAVKKADDLRTQRSWIESIKEIRRERRAGNDRIIRNYMSNHGVRKLHLGCGDHEMPGWLNSDLNPKDTDTAYVNVLEPFPLPADSFDFAYSEHMIEHLSYEQGQTMLRECYRVLKPGGRIRIVTPDLRFLTSMHGRYKTDLQRRYIDWASKKWLSGKVSGYDAFTINHFVRAWGHQFIYDEESLGYAFREAGFHNLEKCSIGESRLPDLCGLENEPRMPEGFLRLESLTIEGVK